MRKLTAAKKKALLLLVDSPRFTTKNTHHGYIGGRVAHCLVRDGLAKRRLSTPLDGSSHASVYEITDAGREAIERNKSR